MHAKVYWIETPLTGRLAIVPRPRANDWLADEIAGWRAEGIDLVVSLLGPEEVSELGLHSEESLCCEHMMEFVSFPFSDRGVPPSWSEASALAHLLVSRVIPSPADYVLCGWRGHQWKRVLSRMVSHWCVRARQRCATR
jgi:hypothetical protein